ncbi:hypothetical protein GE21DRAFT_1278562 [Neurospora crassa]|nr:hypothetical protein GE21DRAFT_1278562 [Neurospora crassa]
MPDSQLHADINLALAQKLSGHAPVHSFVPTSAFIFALVCQLFIRILIVILSSFF